MNLPNIEHSKTVPYRSEALRVIESPKEIPICNYCRFQRKNAKLGGKVCWLKRKKYFSYVSGRPYYYHEYGSLCKHANSAGQCKYFETSRLTKLLRKFGLRKKRFFTLEDDS